MVCCLVEFCFIFTVFLFYLTKVPILIKYTMEVGSMVWGDMRQYESKWNLYTTKYSSSLLYINFYINQKPKVQAVFGDSFALQNENYMHSAHGGKFLVAFPLFCILDTTLNPTTSSDFSSFSLTNIPPTFLTNSKCVSEKGSSKKDATVQLEKEFL